jgi:molybdate transport system regulatory protein
MAIDGSLKLNAQLLRGKAPAIGPGKAMVLEAIDRTGSISAAGRELGMSYRRTWLLVHALNTDWRETVVEAQAGGGKGTRLTAFGRALLDHYREMEAAMMVAARGPAFNWMADALRPSTMAGTEGEDPVLP